MRKVALAAVVAIIATPAVAAELDVPDELRLKLLDPRVRIVRHPDPLRPLCPLRDGARIARGGGGAL